jgi:hypothetical protein
MAAAKGKVAAADRKLTPLELDPLTVVDDPDFLARVAKEKNLPAFVGQGLPLLYQ